MAHFVRLIGVELLIVCAFLLLGWDQLGWSFVDPFLTTLLLIGSPFLVGMGLVDAERLETVPLPPALA